MSAQQPSARPFGLVPALLVLAAGLLLNTVLGPLLLDRIDYPIGETMLNQLIGLEVVTTVLVVPLTVWAAVLAHREHPGAPLVAIGPAAYSAYMFLQYVLGPEYESYSVTVLFHLLLFSLATGVTLWTWSLAQTGPVPVTTSRQRRRRAVLLGAFAGFIVLRYLPALAGAVGGERITAEFLDERTFFWSIVLLDLGLVVPATVVGAVGLWRGRPAGDRAQYALLGWFALVPPSVAAMAGVMLANGDEHASWPTFVLLCGVALVFAAVAVGVFRPVFGAAAPWSGLTDSTRERVG